MAKRSSQRRVARSRIGVAILLLGLSLSFLVSETEEAQGQELANAARASTPSFEPEATERESDHARAAELREAGELDEARRILTALLSDGEGENARTRYELGMTLFELEELDLAEEHLEVALELQPDDAEIVFGMAQVIGSKATLASNPISQFSHGTRAKKLLDRAVELDETLVDARLGRMLFYVYAPALIGGGIERAREEAAAITELNEVAGLFASGWIAEEGEEPELAETLYEQALEKDPAYTPARFRLGYLLLEHDQFEDAHGHFEACREHEPRDPRSHQGLARCLLGEGDAAGAIELHRHALELSEEFSASIFGLAESYAERGRPGDHELARSHFQRFLELRDDGEPADEARAWLDEHAAD